MIDARNLSLESISCPVRHRCSRTVSYSRSAFVRASPFGMNRRGFFPFFIGKLLTKLFSEKLSPVGTPAPLALGEGRAKSHRWHSPWRRWSNVFARERKLRGLPSAVPSKLDLLPADLSYSANAPFGFLISLKLGIQQKWAGGSQIREYST